MIRYAVFNISTDAFLYLVDVDSAAPAYVPPAGAGIRLATPQDEEAASQLPGYAPLDLSQ